MAAQNQQVKQWLLFEELLGGSGWAVAASKLCQYLLSNQLLGADILAL
jgi:hypothetical protein